jgi:hypothetical protein
MLWSTAQDLITCYGPQRRIWFHVLSIALDLVWCYCPQRRIWFHVMVHSAGSDSMLWSAEQDGCIAAEKNTALWNSLFTK